MERGRKGDRSESLGHGDKAEGRDGRQEGGRKGKGGWVKGLMTNLVFRV